MAFNKFLLHGWCMWISWFLFAGVQLTTHRYLKGILWKQAFWIHAMTGVAMFVITFSFAMYALDAMNWALKINVHFYFVFPTFILVGFVALAGALVKSKGDKGEWNTKSVLSLKTFHRSVGYLFIVLGQGGVTSGIYYYRINPKHPIDFPLEWLQLIAFLLIIFILELIHRRRHRIDIEIKAADSSSAHVDDKRVITKDEFKELIRGGHQLVILDDFVVDVSKFILLHPGGQFSLRQNIGRDVSKFFHGGYSLENIDAVKNHVHSIDAKQIVNQLIIGHFVDEAPAKLMTVVGVDRNTNRTGSCKTFLFRETRQTSVENEGIDQKLLQDKERSDQ